MEGNNQQGSEVKKLLSDKSVFPSLTDHKKTINLWRVNK